MELILNIAWLFLALPAYWLWRGARSASGGRDQKPSHNLLALGCMLVLLFPVVSASDDVCATQDCTEESSRTVRQASNEKPSGCKFHAFPALAGTACYVIEISEAWQVLPTLSLFQLTPPMVERSGRAPPTNPFLG